MTCDCSKCSCEGQATKSSSSSSFIFGLIIGAVIGSVIAVVIYRQNKGKIFDDLQKKLEDFFKKLIGEQISESKISVSENKKSSIKHKKNKVIAVPTSKVETPISPPPITFVRKPAPKTFIKPKK